MRLSLRFVLILAAIIALENFSALASREDGSTSVRTVRFSGVLHEGTGEVLSGVQNVTFALYPQQTEGAPLWLEMQNVTADEKGNYTVLLGSRFGLAKAVLARSSSAREGKSSCWAPLT